LLRRSTRQSRIPQLHNLALRRSRRRSSLLNGGGDRGSLLNNGRSRSNLLNSGSRSNLLNGGSRSNLLNSGSRSNLLNLNRRSHDSLLYNSRYRITRFRHIIYLTTKNYSISMKISK
jgi:type IV secretory pathway TrbD component